MSHARAELAHSQLRNERLHRFLQGIREKPSVRPGTSRSRQFLARILSSTAASCPWALPCDPLAHATSWITLPRNGTPGAESSTRGVVLVTVDGILSLNGKMRGSSNQDTDARIAAKLSAAGCSIHNIRRFGFRLRHRIKNDTGSRPCERSQGSGASHVAEALASPWWRVGSSCVR